LLTCLMGNVILDSSHSEDETMTDYTASEMMVVTAARLLRDSDVVFVGIGLPNLACNLARRTHAPNLNLIYEAGVIGAQPARLPLLDWRPVPGLRRGGGLLDVRSVRVLLAARQD